MRRFCVWALPLVFRGSELWFIPLVPSFEGSLEGLRHKAGHHALSSRPEQAAFFIIKRDDVNINLPAARKCSRLRSIHSSAPQDSPARSI